MSTRLHALRLAASICVVSVLCAAASPARAVLVMHLKFDETSGSSTAADATGNGHNGTLVNAITATAWVTGVAGNALQFDGVDDYLDVPDDAALDFGTGDFSVSFWVNKRATSSSNSNNWGVTKWQSGGATPGQNEWMISLSSSGNNDNPRFAIESGTTTFTTSSPDAVSLNSFHHLVGVRSGGSMLLYVDGVLKAVNNTLGTSVINNVGRDLRVANSGINNFYTNGVFDDLQLYNQALTDGGIGVGELATGEIGFLFNNPGLTTNDIPFIPEPSTLLLLGLGSAALAAGGRRRKGRQ